MIFHYMDIPHVCIRLWVDGHLYCLYFWILWIMLLQTFMCRCLCGHIFSIHLGVYLGVELLAHIIIQHVTFWRAARLFLKWQYHQREMYEDSNFLHLFQHLLCLFDYSHAGGCKMVLLCGIDLHLIAKNAGHLFVCFLTFLCLLREMSIQTLCSFLFIIFWFIFKKCIGV